MRKIPTIFISLFLLASCGVDKIERLDIEPEFSEYVSRFEEDSSRFGKKVKVKNLVLKMSYKIEPQYLGVCYMYSNNARPPEVHINGDHWYYLAEESKEQLIYHELGHCVLHREHRKATNNGVALSLMNPTALSWQVYQANHKQYIHELFKREDLKSELPLISLSQIIFGNNKKSSQTYFSKMEADFEENKHEKCGGIHWVEQTESNENEDL